MSSETPLLITNIAELDADIGNMLNEGSALSFYTKWIAPQPDENTRMRYVRYVSERIHSAFAQLAVEPPPS